MGHTVDNAIILAAGTASRFAPLSYERPKALFEVRGEILIERQIRQLQQAGVPQIILVLGYKKEQFAYLQDKFGVILVENPDYLHRNNHSSLYAVRDFLKNSYVCSSDNYFSRNPFESEVDESYYSAVYSKGPTNEWCITQDADGYIDSVQIGGSDAWFMLGHTFWTADFSRRFLEILDEAYPLPETRGLLWESIYMRHLNQLKMKLRPYPDDVIFEFDTLDELRLFDPSYIQDTRSQILKEIAAQLNCGQQDLSSILPCKTNDAAADGIFFQQGGTTYQYSYSSKQIRRCSL